MVKSEETTAETTAQAFDQAGDLIQRQQRILDSWQRANRATRRAEMKQPHHSYFTKKFANPKSREKARQEMLFSRSQAKLDLMAMSAMIQHQRNA